MYQLEPNIAFVLCNVLKQEMFGHSEIASDIVNCVKRTIVTYYTKRHGKIYCSTKVKIHLR